MTQKTKLQELLDLGQSPWIDNITRDMLQDGTLQGLIDNGIVGLTSNPTIFQKAIAGSKLYEDEVRDLVRQDKSVDDIYDALVLDDIETPPDASYRLRPDERRRWVRQYRGPAQPGRGHSEVSGRSPPTIWQVEPAERDGQDPRHGRRPSCRPASAVRGHQHQHHASVLGRKLQEGGGGVRFGWRTSAAGKPIDGIASVASFFVSRVDTAVDKQLETMITQTNDDSRKTELRFLQGKAAIANAKMAYEASRRFSPDRAGTRWRRRARVCSAACGRAPAPRIRIIPTCSTSMR